MTEPEFTLPSSLPKTLPVLGLKQGILMPGAISPFTIGREKSLAALAARGPDGLVLVAIQREPVEDPGPADFLPVLVVARVVRGLAKSGRYRSVLLQGIARARLVEPTTAEPHLESGFELVRDRWPSGPEAEGLKEAIFAGLRRFREVAGEELPLEELMGKLGGDPGLLVDAVAFFLHTDPEFKRSMLLTTDPLVRGQRVLEELAKVEAVLSAQRAIQDRVKAEVKDNEREVVLRKQLKAIQAELGDDKDDEVKRLKDRLAALPLPEEARSAVDRELERLARMPQASAERSVALDWLGWVADLPWGKATAETIDLSALEARLDETHYGLKDVKRQVVEHLAVRKLEGEGRADVLLLVGPPGVGKTSIAQAIADATGRRLLRVALGGVRDEAELRGHRRTYVGARPGRLIEGLRRAGVADPVVLLDEVDKLGKGWQGDPAAALLEILDPEQNHAFVDHYLEVPFDLSRALFVATANDLSAISPVLRDRMEVIELDGYTRVEKLAITRKHVLTKLAKNTGLSDSDVVIDDRVIERSIAGWTREAGVRQLQRVLGRIFRAAAVKKAKNELDRPLTVTVDELGRYLGKPKFQDERHEAPTRPGVATGLAWTPVGGDVLYVEASLVPGKGKLVLTGQLGDVMKESAQAALTFLLADRARLGIANDALEKQDVHVHVPAGATPKDGPSAGVTMASALASALTGRPLRGDLAMTGEITLRGRVLPVGGIKAKVLAAHAQGLKRVLLPAKNAPDVEELPAEIRAELEIVLVDDLDAVLAEALLPAELGARAQGDVRRAASD